MNRPNLYLSNPELRGGGRTIRTAKTILQAFGYGSRNFYEVGVTERFQRICEIPPS